MKNTWPKQLPLTPETERAVAFYSCTDAAFFERYGRHVQSDMLSELGADETINMRAPCRVAMLAAHGVAARRGNGAGPSCAAEAVQWLRSMRHEGKVTQEEEEAVRRLLDAAEHDRQRPSLEAVARDLSHELTIHFKAQLALAGIHGHLDEVKEWLRKIEGLSANGAASDIETVVEVLDGIKAERTDWFSEGRLARGDLSLAVGDPGVGKGLVCISAAAAVTKGWPFLGGKPREPARVLLLSTEDSPERTLKPRLVAAGGDAELALIQKIKRRGETRLPMLCPEELAAVERVVVDRGVGLVVVDPVVDFVPLQVGPDRIDADTQRGVRRVLLLLHEFARRTGTVVLAVVHLNKSTASGKLLYRIIGSIAHAAVARSVLAVAKDPAGSERRVLAVAKLNDGIKARSIYFDILSDYPTIDGQEIPTARIEWGTECSVEADDLVEPPENKKKDGPIDQAISFLKKALASGPRIASEVIDEALNGELFSKHTLLNAKRRLGVVAKRLPGQKVEWEWSMPESQTEKDVEPDGQAS